MRTSYILSVGTYRSSVASYRLSVGVLAVLTAAACGPSNSPPSGPRDTGEFPSVPFGGGETSDLGSGSEPDCTFTSPEPISREEALAAGVDPNLIAGSRSIDLQWNDCPRGAESCGSTTLKETIWVDSFHRGHLSRSRPDITYGSCRADQYSMRALVRWQTADGKLDGAFYVRVSQAMFVEDGGWIGKAEPDPRNFRGSLRLPLNVQRPHFSAFEVSMGFGAYSGRSLGLLARYEDGSRPEWSNIALTGGSDARLDGMEADPDGASVRLDDYVGSLQPPTLPLTAHVSGWPVANLPADVEVTINEKSTTYPYLTPADGTISLGAIPRDAHVVVTAVNGQTASGSLNVSLTATNCNFNLASGWCNEVNCVARAEYNVRYERCINY